MCCGPPADFASPSRCAAGFASRPGCADVFTSRCAAGSNFKLKFASLSRFKFSAGFRVASPNRCAAGFKFASRCAAGSASPSRCSRAAPLVTVRIGVLRRASLVGVLLPLMKVYDGEPLQVLFKFSGAQATRRMSRAQLPFWSQSLFLFQIRRLIGTESREST